MSALQKANLGTAPTGAGGDDQRTANTRFNANVDVLSTQAALTTAGSIATSQALTAAHIGKRIGVNITGGGTINLPVASTCPADGVMLIRNVSGGVLSLAVAAGSGDSLALGRLNSGESVLLDTDGVKSWRILMRGRSYTPDETVIGNQSVGGSATIGTDASIGRDVTVGGKVLATGEMQCRSTNAYRMVSSGDYGTFWRKDSTALYLMRTAAGDQFGNWDTARPFTYSLKDDKVTIDGTGAGCSIGSRPTFAGKTPWDNGNLVSPWHAGNMTRPAVFSANGGTETDLNPSAYETRLSVDVVVGAGGTIMATATAALNLAAGVGGATDVLMRFRIADGATVVFDGQDDVSTVAAADAGLGGREKLVATLAKDGLTPGKKYTLQLLLKKTQPVGPLYPRVMRIAGITT
ncbi:hypothetical protein DIE14_12530 [Burkholderia sp. Bp9017]|uniref:phage tail fiber protein n=1 Tax=unclassified Burkholderia TaxID=2613784 RepID=UPI000F60031D|nr:MULTISPECIES: hypothetical protein [unclassified Burkholderia]RQZ27306.1 hypothetical protein DIE14_12530 [Burkholderia sp. Bp9017]RQZ34585.1 hypothetical protein DIE13_13510 [Burkholderia sp. Bp9016]